MQAVVSPALLKCAACGVAFYCSPRCQRIDWRVTHKSDCLALRTALSGPFSLEMAPSTMYATGVELPIVDRLRLCWEACESCRDPILHDASLVSEMPMPHQGAVTRFSNYFLRDAELKALSVRQLRLVLKCVRLYLHRDE